MPGFDGFLGTRASFMLDVVTLALVVILPAMTAAILLARWRRNYRWHKRIQLVLGIVLLITVAAFEADMRINGWRERAEPSPFASHDGSTDWVAVALGVHLCFAVTTALLWIAVITLRAAELSQPAGPFGPQPMASPLRLCRGHRHGDDRNHRLGVLLAGVRGVTRRSPAKSATLTRHLVRPVGVAYNLSSI